MYKFEARNPKYETILKFKIEKSFKHSKIRILNLFRASSFEFRISSQKGITALAVLTILGLFLAVSLALVGTGTIQLPWGAQIPVSPIPVSDPVEDDEACNDPANAECEPFVYNDPEDLTPEEIQRALEEN